VTLELTCCPVASRGPAWPERVATVYPDSYASIRRVERGGVLRTEGHNAVDIGTPRPCLAVAPVPGVIYHAGWDGYGGWSVGIETTGVKSNRRYRTYMAHLAFRPDVRAGARIDAGTPIGVTGHSGGAHANGEPTQEGEALAGPLHLHFAQWVADNGTWVVYDPTQVVVASFTTRVHEFTYLLPNARTPSWEVGPVIASWMREAR